MELSIVLRGDLLERPVQSNQLLHVAQLFAVFALWIVTVRGRVRLLRRRNGNRTWMARHLWPPALTYFAQGDRRPSAAAGCVKIVSNIAPELVTRTKNFCFIYSDRYVRNGMTFVCLAKAFVEYNRRFCRILRIVPGDLAVWLKLDYLSCILTIASTILVGRRCWKGWVLAAINSVLICVIGVRTAQYGFIPANVFCIGLYAANLRAWRKADAG